MTQSMIIATASLLAGCLLISAGCVNDKSDPSVNSPRTDPAYTAHAAHAATDATQAGKPSVEGQLADLRGKIQRLERLALAHSEPSPPADRMPAGSLNPPTTQTTPTTTQNAMGMPGNPMGMSVTGNHPSRPSAMQNRMLKLAGMMDAMMDQMQGRLASGAMQPSASMPGSTPTSGMGMSTRMGEDRMEMIDMMGRLRGKGAPGMAMASAKPGIPGVSHLYHVGASGFFLDLPHRIPLTAEQRMALTRLENRATLDKASTDRRIETSEQGLWMLTAAEQPDNVKIEAKVAELEKLRGEARLRFISGVEQAAMTLTEEQRNLISGWTPPAHSLPASAAAPLVGSGVGGTRSK